MTIIKQSEYLKLSYYGDPNKYQLMITCPHAYLGTEFLEKFPELQKHIKLPPTALQKFLAIEQDFGTEELGEQLGRFCAEEYGISTLVVQPLFPRSILDAGRLEPNNIRNIIDYTKAPHLHEQFLEIHADYIRTLKQLVAQLNTNSGIALDLHTMSSFSPSNAGDTAYSEAINETPDTLLEYIESYKASHLNGWHREVELFSGDAKNNIFADQSFIDAVCRNLSELDIPVEFDSPYVVAPHLTGYYLLQNARTVCIDIPKNLVSKESTQDDNYSLANLSIDQQKLDQMTQALASAANTALNTHSVEKGEVK